MREPREGSSPEGAPTTTATPEAGDAAAPPARDIVFVHGPTPHGVQITRLREDRVESGELRPLQEGKPIIGEVVRLSPRKESERVFDVEVLARTTPAPEPAATADRKGPTRVANERFRQNWDVVFGPSIATRKGDLPS